MSFINLHFILFHKTVHRIQEDDSRSTDHTEPVSHISRTREIQEEQKSCRHHSEQLQKLSREAALVTETARRETQQETGGTLHAKGLKQVRTLLCALELTVFIFKGWKVMEFSASHGKGLSIYKIIMQVFFEEEEKREKVPKNQGYILTFFENN